MASPNSDSEPPRSIANVAPVDINADAGRTRMMVDTLKESVADIRADVKEIKGHRFSDFLWHIGVMGAGVLLIASMVVAAYFRLEDKIHALSTASTRIDTKLEDLLQRIPPVPSAAPQKR